MSTHTLFIFRRDYRLIDNKGLEHCMNNCKNVLPIFIFTPEQVTNKNKYKSDNAIQFMIESLNDLNGELKKHGSKLHTFYGKNVDVLKKICNKINVERIVFNMDYTPYAIKRDKKIKKFCKKNDIECVICEDYLLAPIGKMLKKNGEPYTIFTPFLNNGLEIKIDKPVKSRIKKLVKVNKLDESGFIKYVENENILVRGGRKNALKKLSNVAKMKKYDQFRNTVSIPTTQLSAYIKFGCISVREVYWCFKKTNATLLSQLFWRDFYYYIAWYFPEVMKGENYRFKKLKWKWNDKNKINFKKWCNGETGFDIVDAGMKQLNETGYMHNRARLITSNFLNRILNIDWRHGEKYFAKMLIDYDPCVNNGNWQWIASVGVDPKPYYQRIFNPYLQEKKYDSDKKYITKWLYIDDNDDDNDNNNDNNNYNKNKNNSKNKDRGVDEIVDYKNGRKKNIELYRKL